METGTQAATDNDTRTEGIGAVLRQAALPDESIALAVECAREVMAITQDLGLAQAAALRAMMRTGQLPAATTEQLFGEEIAELAAALERIEALQPSGGWSSGPAGPGPGQAEALRKMLLAVAADPRLVVARLALQLVAMRHARDLSASQRQRLAAETRDLFAPLANRLGVWHMKWELEDLALRYLEPEEYRRIAAALAQRRVDREQYIRDACEHIERELAKAGVAGAQVSGRPKHIHSILAKMRRKGLAFEQLFDVRAVRVVVNSVDECYAALGVIHASWPYIAGEFDDYIATPKDNDYRSIHTAVIGPEGKSLEVQIRTREMHEHAERGVAAHWTYKEGGARDNAYAAKIEWARRVLDPQRHSADAEDPIERARAQIFADRIYAMTPRGEIVDLPQGATPLDFAYHVHTELGHRCRGARINGRIAPLDRPLAHGDVVDVITGKMPAPSRDWLAPDQGYLRSSRSRAKVRAWFRRIDELAERAHAPDPEPITEPAVTPPALPTISPVPAKPSSGRPSRSPVLVEGVGDLPVTIARCCSPVPPERIQGYMAPGRGVTIHRAECSSFLRMRERAPDRVLRVAWNQGSDAAPLAVRIRVEAVDRRGLLRDVSDVLAAEKLSIFGVNSDTDPLDQIAVIVMRSAVRDTEQLTRVLKKLGQVEGVLKTARLG